MFGIGMPELILILVIALIVLGPSKLPEIAKTLGRGMAEFRRATEDLRDNLMAEEPRREEPPAPGAQATAAASGTAEAAAAAAPALTSSGAAVGQPAPSEVETPAPGESQEAPQERAPAPDAGDRSAAYVEQEMDFGDASRPDQPGQDLPEEATAPSGTRSEAPLGPRS